MTMATELVRERRPAGAEALYGRDLYAWCVEQAALLRAGRLDAIDVANIAEEIEALGSEQGDKLESAYRVLLLHLLKWRFQAGRRTKSWSGSITRERLNAARVLRKNPGLKSRRRELFADAYADARKLAASETGLPRDVFPADCPFGLEQALDDDFLPDAAP
jgi:hypothetical protein